MILLDKDLKLFRDENELIKFNIPVPILVRGMSILSNEHCSIGYVGCKNSNHTCSPSVWSTWVFDILYQTGVTVHWSFTPVVGTWVEISKTDTQLTLQNQNTGINRTVTVQVYATNNYGGETTICSTTLNLT